MAKCVDAIIRFNQKYVVDEETGCWNWVGYIEPNGYGHSYYKRKTIRAHKLSYILFKNDVNPDLVICHSCNNRKCVNPDHLREDTRSSNAIDMVKIKKQHRQILSVEEVIEIKKALKHYYRGQVNDLAHFYKVNQRTISGIKKGKNWSHVIID